MTKFIAIISLSALKGQTMTVKVHSSLCMTYSRWVILLKLQILQACQTCLLVDLKDTQHNCLTETEVHSTYIQFNVTCAFVWKIIIHRLQPSRNLWDSPGFLAIVPGPGRLYYYSIVGPG